VLKVNEKVDRSWGMVGLLDKLQKVGEFLIHRENEKRVLRDG